MRFLSPENVIQIDSVKKFADRLDVVTFVETSYLNTDMCKS